MFYSDLLVTAGQRLAIAAARTRLILPATTVPRAINQQLPREADTSTALLHLPASSRRNQVR